MSKSNSNPASESTLGEKLDAILAPFAADEQRLMDTIGEMEAQVAKLADDIENSRSDLSVVQTSKIESLRDAAKDDSLLSAAFLGVAAAAEAQQQQAEESVALASDEAATEGDSEGHSLLQM
ncbi:MAG: hypothetical protein V3V20_01145 [Algisphaera sp.]